jgi:transcriptional regulator with XRE-family HTH domain
MQRKKKPRGVTNVDAEIGNRIRAYRMDRNLSQDELGEALGVSFQQIQKYEKGANRLAAGRVIEICKALEISPLELMGWDKHAHKVGDAIDAETFKLVKTFIAMPNHLKAPFRTLMSIIINGA